MKASERLRELDRELREHEIIRVLPLIADVVEAAEAAATRRQGFLENDELRDALTALRDALDDGCDTNPIRDWGFGK